MLIRDEKPYRILRNIAGNEEESITRFDVEYGNEVPQKTSYLIHKRKIDNQLVYEVDIWSQAGDHGEMGGLQREKYIIQGSKTQKKNGWLVSYESYDLEWDEGLRMIEKFDTSTSVMEEGCPACEKSYAVKLFGYRMDQVKAHMPKEVQRGGEIS